MMLPFSFLVLSALPALAADRVVDLQFALCEPETERLPSKLGFEGDPKELVVSYFDDASGSLTKNGIFLKTKEKGDEVVSEVKVVYSPFQALPEGVKCETDRYGTHREKKCSLENESEGKPRWTRAQKTFAESKTKIAWNSLHAIGPFLEYRWKNQKDDLWDGLDSSLDVLVVPGEEPITELSLKVNLEHEEETYQYVLSMLNRRRIQLCAKQMGKIQRLLKVMNR